MFHVKHQTVRVTAVGGQPRGPGVATGEGPV
ncbi:hypothetical protein STRAU_6501 [Streptomyces aurantiacus JA 4570]|uniref:Uncharacterized protein n=1 Tax=Streptomyces aurantiacus JA 4570 TaxID=1286094 RepID=S3ZCW7_9ACTN|nr:hypothetical protein STRAU_6501 [Streptomyces aurantiacus JA 4570]